MYIFTELGYTIDDSELLVNIYQRQAAKQYYLGEYSLGEKDEYGQRITINIELPGIRSYQGKIGYIKTGWVIKADGSFYLATPYCGFYK